MSYIVILMSFQTIDSINYGLAIDKQCDISSIYAGIPGCYCPHREGSLSLEENLLGHVLLVRKNSNKVCLASRLVTDS